MLGNMLVLDLFTRPQQLTVIWVEQLLYHLWTHGLRFHKETNLPPTWEDELSGEDFRGFWQGDESSYDNLSLQTFLARAASSAAAMTTVWDKELEMNLELNPGGANLWLKRASVEPFGRVRLWIDGSYLRALPTHPSSEAYPLLLTPAQQVLEAFTHWTGVLCDYLEPLLALGDEPEGERPSQYYEQISQALMTGTIPEKSDWPFLIYIAPQLIDNELRHSLWEKKGRWMRSMRQGGVLLVDAMTHYAYETAEAHRQVALGETIEQVLANTDEEYRRAAHYFERAQGIFAQASDEKDAWLAKTASERMRGLINIRSQLDQIKQLPRSITLLLDGGAESQQTIASELAQHLGNKAEQMPRDQILYRLADRHLSLLLKKRAPEAEVSDGRGNAYNYELIIRSTVGQLTYIDPQEWLSALETEAHSLFDLLKKTGKYRLALLLHDGTISENPEATR